MRVRSSAGALVLVGLLSTSLAAQSEAKELVRRLGGKDNRDRHDAYRELQRTKPAGALLLLASELPKFPLHAQNLGFSVVQGYPGERAERTMRRFLAGSSPFLAVAAGAYLYQRGDRSVTARLVAALRKPVAKSELSQMLGRVQSIRDPAVLAAVMAHVKPDAGIAALETALRHALNVQHRPAIAVVSGLLAEPDQLKVEERAVCAAFLVAMGEQGHNKLLAAAIRDMLNFSRVRDFLGRAPTVDREVLAAVLDFIDGKRGHQVGYALRLLAKHDYGPAVRKMRELLESDDVQVSKAAFDSLMQMGTGLEPKHLRALLTSDKSQVAIAAADALRRLDDHGGVDKLIEFAKKPGKNRLEAVDALGKFRSRRVVPTLIGLLEDKDQQVRARAERGLQNILRGMFPYRAPDLAGMGYRSRGPAAKRQEAVAKIRSWWSLRGGKK